MTGTHTSVPHMPAPGLFPAIQVMGKQCMNDGEHQVCATKENKIDVPQMIVHDLGVGCHGFGKQTGGSLVPPASNWHETGTCNQMCVHTSTNKCIVCFLSCGLPILVVVTVVNSGSAVCLLDHCLCSSFCMIQRKSPQDGCDHDE